MTLAKHFLFFVWGWYIMKKIKILIIVLIALIVIGGATFATLYFATDIFKSEQEMFYKYIKQVDLSSFTNFENSEKYLARMKNEKTSNSGNVSVDVVLEGESFINEEYIYETKTDPTNKMSSANIDVKQEGQEGLTINYLRNQDLYGIMIPDVLTQHIIFENNNLKEFAQRLEIEEIDEIPDKIELNLPENTQNIDLEQINQILNKYLEVAIETIPEENYSKIAKKEIAIGSSMTEVDGYQLTISEKDFGNIILNILNTLKSDEEIFNLLESLTEEEITFLEYSEAIGSLIQELEDSKESLDAINQIFNIRVYKKGKETVRIYSEIIMEDSPKINATIDNLENQIDISFNVVDNNEYYNTEMNVKITKNKNVEEQEQLTMQFSLIEDNLEYINANITLERIGRLDSQTIANNANIDIAINTLAVNANDISENSINIKSTNSITFNPNIQIEEYDDENLAIINYFGKEPIEYLATSIAEGVKNKIDLEKNLFVGPIIFTYSLQSGLFTAAQNAADQVQDVTEQEESLSSGYIDINGEEYNVNTQLSNMVVETFNSQFTVYEGDNKSASQVRALISLIETSNSTQINQVSYTDITVEFNKEYSITFIKDAEGYINRVIITEM